MKDDKDMVSMTKDLVVDNKTVSPNGKGLLFPFQLKKLKRNLCNTE